MLPSTPGLANAKSNAIPNRCAWVIACDDEILPLRERVETISDEADLEDVHDTERYLPYVAFSFKQAR